MNLSKIYIPLTAIILLFFSCNDQKKNLNMQSENLSVNDIHSFAQPTQAVITHLDWQAAIDFDHKKIEATATYRIKAAENVNKIILDSKGINIFSIKDGESGANLNYDIGQKKENLGKTITIESNLLYNSDQANPGVYTSPAFGIRFNENVTIRNNTVLSKMRLYDNAGIDELTGNIIALSVIEDATIANHGYNLVEEYSYDTYSLGQNSLNLDKDDFENIFDWSEKKLIKHIDKINSKGEIELIRKKPGFGLSINENKLKKLSDKYATV